VLEAPGDYDAAEAELIRRLVAVISAADPDVIESHNLTRTLDDSHSSLPLRTEEGRSAA
jgi:hypothetical protein